MAQILQSCFLTSPKTFVPRSKKSSNCYGKLYVANQRLRKKKSPVIVRCSSTKSISHLIKNGVIKEKGLEHLVSEYGWRVRRVMEDDHGEIRSVTLVQAEAFHIPMFLFDDLFFEFFKAEVLSGLLYKLRNSPPDRYACLVAEPESVWGASESTRRIVGVVDVTVLRDESVLKHSPGTEEYLYVSGLAVSKSLRRRKIGSVMLKACDVVCCVWGYKLLALRAYEDDVGALKLYSNAGFRVVSADPPWFSIWLGRKRRVLMIKQFP